MSDPVVGWPVALARGVTAGLVQASYAIAFGSLVFLGRTDYFTAEGIALWLAATAATLAVSAWREGRHGGVWGPQATGAALLSVLAATTGVRVQGSPFEGFLAVVAGTVVLTVVTGVVALLLGVRRSGDLVRAIPVPVVGGFLAGVGWLLATGGIHLAIGESPFYTHLADLIDDDAWQGWLPALAFGVVLVAAVRVRRRPSTLPIMLGAGLLVFVVLTTWMGASIDDARAAGWLLGPFERPLVWKTWGAFSLVKADWLAVARSWPTIVAAAVIGPVALLHAFGGSERLLGRDLDTDHRFRTAGLVDVVSGLLGGGPAGPVVDPVPPGAGGRRVGLAAALVPLGVLLFAPRLVALVPRVLIAGLLIFVGLSLLVEWLWDRRRSLATIEYLTIVVILAVVIWQGIVVGFVVGLVLAAVLFAVNYGRVDLVHEVPFGTVARSRVERATAERARLSGSSDRVQIVRVEGYVFFGSTNRLWEAIRGRLEGDRPPRVVLVDLTRVTGIDASAMATLTRVDRLAKATGTEVVLCGARAAVLARLERAGVARLERAGVAGASGSLTVAQSLDAALERTEDLLLTSNPSRETEAGIDGLPPELRAHLDPIALPAGTPLFHQGDPPGDLFVLDEGRLAVEVTTPDGRQVHLRTVRAGVVVGEVAFYTGMPRTATVVALDDAVVLRLPRSTIEAWERE